MTQDVRLALINSKLIEARQNVHLATMLSQTARQPTIDEADAISDVMGDIVKDLTKMRKFLLLDAI